MQHATCVPSFNCTAVLMSPHVSLDRKACKACTSGRLVEPVCAYAIISWPEYLHGEQPCTHIKHGTNHRLVYVIVLPWA